MKFKKQIIILFFIVVSNSYYAQHRALNYLRDTVTICNADSFLIKFQSELISKNATFQWITPYSIIYQTKQLYVKQKGLYIVKISDGKKQYADTTYVKVIDKPKFNIKDTLLCSTKGLLINAPKKLDRYLWNTGDISNALKIDKPGKYWIKVNNKGCAYTDTFKVNAFVGVIPNFGKEYVVCENEPNKVLSVKADSDVKVFWNTGSNATSISPQKEGIYWVKSISKQCGTKADSVTVKFKNCDCDIFIPNSFTPNDDDRNDLFIPVFQCEYVFYSLTIYDRWNNIVYNSNNINASWDGRFKGNICPDDVYVYRLVAIQKSNEKKVVRNGHISLFR